MIWLLILGASALLTLFFFFINGMNVIEEAVVAIATFVYLVIGLSLITFGIPWLATL